MGTREPKAWEKIEVEGGRVPMRPPRKGGLEEWESKIRVGNTRRYGLRRKKAPGMRK